MGPNQPGSLGIFALKTSGEIYIKVKNAGEGNGLEARKRIHKFMTQVSGQGIMQKQHSVLYPEPCTNEVELAGELEKWLEDVRLLNKHIDSAVPENQRSVILRMKIEKLATKYLIDWDKFTNFRELLEK